MNEIESQFLIDLSDLIFDKNYKHYKKVEISKNNIQSKEKEIKTNFKNSYREKNKYEKVSKDKKTEKLEIKTNSNQNAKNEAKLEEIHSKESNKEKSIDGYFKKIDTFNSFNFLLDEKIKKIKSKDGSNNDYKRDIIDKEEFIEDFFSPIDIKSNSSDKVNNSEKNEKKKINCEKGKNDRDYDFFKTPIFNNNNYYNKNDKNEKHEKNKESHKKINLSFNQRDSTKSISKETTEKEKSKISAYTSNILINNTNSHYMKVSSAIERNIKFSNLLERGTKYEESDLNDITRINNNNISKKELINNNSKDNQKLITNNISQTPTQNKITINLQKRSQENLINIPLCNFNEFHLSNLKEKLNTIIFHKNQSVLNDSNQTESIDLSQSFNSNINFGKTINQFYSFYQKTIDDPLLQKHLFIHPKLRLRFLKAYPINKKLIAKDYLYNIVNGEVKNIYGKIKEKESLDNILSKKSIYFIKLLKDKDIEEIYTKIFVTESVLKKKLNVKEISASFVNEELSLNISDIKK